MYLFRLYFFSAYNQASYSKQKLNKKCKAWIQKKMKIKTQWRNIRQNLSKNIPEKQCWNFQQTTPDTFYDKSMQIKIFLLPFKVPLRLRTKPFPVFLQLPHNQEKNRLHLQQKKYFKTNHASLSKNISKNIPSLLFGCSSLFLFEILLTNY